MLILITLMVFALLALMACGFEFPQIVDAIDTVPEKYRGLYAKGEDNKFKLDDEVHKKVDNSGLTSALEKERKERKALDKVVAGWKALGDSPEEIKTKLDALNGDDDGDDDGDEGEKKGKNKLDKKQIQKIKADAEAAVAKTRTEFEGKLTAAQQALKKQMIDTEASVSIAEFKGVPGLLLAHIREKCLLVEEDGVYQVRVVDDEGDPRGNGKGGFMTVRELVAEMRQSEVFGRAFEAEGKSGSGMRQSNGSGGGTAAKLTSVQKIAKGLGQRTR